MKSPAAVVRPSLASPVPARTVLASASAAIPSPATCLELVSWNQRGASAVKALYADTGALTADARANNARAVAAAGRKLTPDARTALANGDATGAFSTATARCS